MRRHHTKNKNLKTLLTKIKTKFKHGTSCKRFHSQERISVQKLNICEKLKKDYIKPFPIR